MTLQTARNAISSTSPKKTKAEGQAILESMVGISKEMLGGTGDFATTKSLATDILTIGNDAMLYVVESESSTTDDFKTIAFSPSGDIRPGMVVGVKPATGHTLTAKPPVSGAKRIITRTGRDLIMDEGHYTWFKFDDAIDAWQQILPDWTALLEFIAGVRAASTLTIGSSVVTGDRAFHIIAGASALNLQAILGNYQDGNVVYIKTDNAYVYTLKHNVAVTGKLNLLTAADIIMSAGVWYAFVKNGTQWDHLWTSSSVAVAASTVGTVGEIALGDGLGGWKKTGAAIAKGSLIVGASASALGVLAAGTNGQVVTYDSAEALGVKAATPSASGGLYGDGADGAKTVSSNTTETVPKIFRLTTLTINTGVTWTVKSGTLILCTGAVDIQGTGQLVVAADIPGATGETAAYYPSNLGLGPSPGLRTAATYQNSISGAGCGGNGGNGGYTAGFNASKGGQARLPCVGLTGSGGAGGTTGGQSGVCGDGGAGGGAVGLYSGSTITIGASAKITANGGAGTAQTGSYGGAGSGGSGGVIDLGALTSITNSGTIEAKGGAGGNGANNGFAAAGGGGGVVCLTSASVTAGTITLTGGAAGTGGTAYTTAPQAGSTGVSYSTTAIPVKYRCF